jgi:hypothetical protein
MMALRTVRAMVFGAAAMVALCGFDQGPALTYNPKHYVNNDPLWDLLNKAEVTADFKKGAYSVKFPTALIDRQGQPFRIEGFILPLETSSRSAHFILVRRNTGCPFCPPNAPTEAIEIMAVKSVNYTGEEITVSGRLKLVSSSADGLFFRLENAEVAERR